MISNTRSLSGIIFSLCSEATALKPYSTKKKSTDAPRNTMLPRSPKARWTLNELRASSRHSTRPRAKPIARSSALVLRPLSPK